MLRHHEKEYLSKLENNQVKKNKAKSEIDKFVASFLKDFAQELHASDRNRNWLYIRGVIHGVFIVVIFIPLLWTILKHFI
jgi:Fe2+ transport system protein B